MKERSGHCDTSPNTLNSYFEFCRYQMLCTPNGIRTNSTRFTRMCRIVDWSEHSRKHSFLFIVWMCGECNHRKRYLEKTQLQNYVPWFSRFNDFATHLSPFHTILYRVWDFIAIIVISSFLFTLTRTHMHKKCSQLVVVVGLWMVF